MPDSLLILLTRMHTEEQLVLRYGMIQMEKLMHLLQVLVQAEQLQVLVNILSLRMTRLR